MEGPYLFAIACVVLLVLPADVSAADPTINIGVWTNFAFMDKVSGVGVYAVYDGLKAAEKAINAAGGLHGRMLKIVECEAYFQEKYYKSCFDHFVQNHSVIATTGIFVDRDFGFLTQKHADANLLLMNPAVLQTYTFSKHWMYIRSHQFLQLRAMLQHIAQVLHRTRIAIQYSLDSGTGTDMLQPLEAAIASLGMRLVATLNVALVAPNFRWRTANYTAFLAARPQVVIALGVSVQSNTEFLTDLLNRSMYGNGVDPDLQLFTWEGNVGSAAIIFPKLQKVNPNFTAASRVFFALALPTLTDARFSATAMARRDMAAFWNGSQSYLDNRTDYHVNSFSYWLAIHVIGEVIRKMDPHNLTRHAFIDKAFAMQSYLVGDLFFGLYSGANCSVPNLCPCNQGYHSVHTYVMTRNGSLEPAIQITTPVGECGTKDLMIEPPLIGLALVYETGSQVAADAIEDMVSASYDTHGLQYVTAPNASAVVATLASAVEDLYFSAVVAAVLTAPANLSSLGDTIFCVDPLYFPAQLTPPFASNTVYLSATLDQEIFVWFSALAQWHQQRAAVGAVHCVFRSREARRILYVAQKSAVTHGVPITGHALAGDAAPRLPFPPAGFAGHILVAGLASAADVAALGAFLRANAEAYAFVAFSEFSVLHRSFAAEAASGGLPAQRLLFATSQGLWHANDTAHMRSYFGGADGAAARSPLALRGSIAHSTLLIVSALLLPHNSTAFNLLPGWYDVAVVNTQKYSGFKFGPFSNTPCRSTGGSEECQTNVGARLVSVYSLLNATAAPGAAPPPLASFTFASGTIAYTQPPVPPPTGLSDGQIAGASVGVGVAVLLLISFAWWKGQGGQRRNDRAPKDPSIPVAMIFTDIQSSTSLWAFVPQLMADVLNRHHELIRQLIEKHACYEVKTVGDAFMIATTDVNAALALAMELQVVFLREAWPAQIDDLYRELEAVASTSTDLPASLSESTSTWNGLRVRAGIHWGIADIRFDETTRGYDYYGTTTNVAARTESQASGGQILLTAAAVAALNADLRSLVVSTGFATLRGVEEPVELFECPVIVGRTFSQRKLVVEDADESPPMSFDVPDGDTRLDLSATHVSEEGIAAQGGSWFDLSAGFVSTLFSTSPAAMQDRTIRALCDRWRIDYTAAIAIKKNFGNFGENDHASVISFSDDPVVVALSRRIAPVMKKRFGALALADNSNTTKSMFSHLKMSAAGLGKCIRHPPTATAADGRATRLSIDTAVPPPIESGSVGKIRRKKSNVPKTEQLQADRIEAYADIHVPADQ